MVDKAQNYALNAEGQVGESLWEDLITLNEKWDGDFASLSLPPGLTAEMVDRAEDLILDWERIGHYRAAPLVVGLFKLFAVGRLAS